MKGTTLSIKWERRGWRKGKRGVESREIIFGYTRGKSGLKKSSRGRRGRSGAVRGGGRDQRGVRQAYVRKNQCAESRAGHRK